MLLRSELILHRRKERFSASGVPTISCRCKEELLRREMATSVKKLVPEGYPIFLDEYLESTNRAVEWVQADLRECRQLSRAIPTVRAVNEYMRGVDVDVANDEKGALHNRRKVS